MIEANLELGIAVAYLLVLSAIAALTERWSGATKAVRHPIVAGLALGVYATSFTLYGGVGYAQRYGYVFLAFYLGVTLSCLAIPFLWRPLSDVVRRHRFTSVPDLLAYRFRANGLGTAVTVFLLAGLLPYLALQLRAISTAATALGGWPWMGVVYTGLLSVFAAGLGARYAEPWGQRPGLLATLAVESLIKLFAAMTIGVMALYDVFGGLSGFDAYLNTHPEVLQSLFVPLQLESFWSAILLVAFFGAFLLPRQFHIAFIEMPNAKGLRHAIWVLPLFLLLVNLPLPVMLVAGMERLPPGTPGDLFVLTWSDRPGARIAAFLAGVSGSSAMVLVSSIALSGMVVNHILLPFRPRRALSYNGLIRLRRVVIGGIVLSAFALHQVLPRSGTLVDLGLVSFSAVLQLAPGVLAALFWPRATRLGVGLGLIGGFLGWAVVTAAPLLGVTDILEIGEPRSTAIWWSVTVNSLLLVSGSLLRRPTRSEARAAEDCAPKGSRRAVGLARNVYDLRNRITRELGEEVAEVEIQRALVALNMDGSEQRPGSLRALTHFIERSLSELVGPLAARDALRVDGARFSPLAEQLQNLSAKEDAAAPAEAWRYLLQALQELPLGLVATDSSGEIVLFNQAAEGVVGQRAEQAIGGRLSDLPVPWDTLTSCALDDPSEAAEYSGRQNGRRKELRARCAHLEDARAVFLIEDLTERRLMRERVAHRDRLSSVGQLAAGVAHEVRNPLTGLLMVARNLLDEPDADDAPERLELILSEGKRIERIVRSLLHFSRSSSEPVSTIEVSALIEDAVRLSRLRPRARHLRWDTMIAPGLRIRADRQGMMQVLLNLMGNAADASPENGELHVVADRDETGVYIDILDQGSGIDPADAPNIFEPFYTTKASGEGTGLGLAISVQIVHAHEGLLTFERTSDARTRFRVWLPTMVPGENDESHFDR